MFEFSKINVLFPYVGIVDLLADSRLLAKTSG